MDREVVFANKAFKYKDILQLKSVLEENENIESIKIYTIRNIKENKVKIRDGQNFDNMDEFIEYLNYNQITKLENIEMHFIFKNKNRAKLEYTDIINNWVLKYDKQDSNIDSLIYNLNSLIKDNIFRKYRKYRWVVAMSIGIFYLFLYNSLKNSFFIYFMATIVLFIEIDCAIFKNLAYKENNFISKNRDSIFLSILFYVLGVITPYIIEFVISLLNK